MRSLSKTLKIGLALGIFLFFNTPSVWAEVRLPRLISHGMVLQQGARVAIWGWAAPQEGVAVSFRDQKVATTAGADGRWRVHLQPLKAGGPDVMTIAGKNTLVLRNVLVGEVWICSGQSNMEMHVGPYYRTDHLGVLNYQDEIAAARYPDIRMFTVTETMAMKPQEDVEGDWREANPVTLADFSAVGYFFARELHEALGVPVGMIHTAHGGSPAEAWVSRPALESTPEFRAAFDNDARKVAGQSKQLDEFEKQYKAWRATADQAESEGKPLPSPPIMPSDYRVNFRKRPACLYNAMLAPLTSYAIRGAIWYQGEENLDRGSQYQRLFSLLIQDWRKAWGQGDFPFLFVQLPNFGDPLDDDNWPLLREAQLRTLSLPKTGMAVTVDIGERDDIHPRNKQEVGRRLALLAKAITYGRNLEYSGPLYKSMVIEGDKVRVQFDHADGGLVARRTAAFRLRMIPSLLKGFEIAGEDRKFVSAEAKIDGDTAVIQSERVLHPVAVRYAWRNDPDCNLYNQAGLPASPFRTDDWPVENRAN